MSSRGYRGRGGRFQPREKPDLSKLQEGLSNIEIGAIALPTRDPEEEVDITDVVALGSYNWVDHTIPTIVIPGNPAMWKEPELPLQLDPDSGNSFIDQNTARLPLNPLEPMLRAISVTQKQLGNDFNLADESIDVVTDRNNLRKLMRFITFNGPNRDPRPGSNRPFRIDVQLAPNGRTLVLTRRDEKTIDDSTRFKGYGHNFEKNTTEHIAPFLATNHTRTLISRLESTGYHRITCFNLSGLRLLVRYEVDAMISAPPVNTSADDAGSEDELDDLSKALAQTSLTNTPTAKPGPKPFFKKPATIVELPGSELRHVIHGELVPQAQVLELRTLKSVFEVTWTDLYPQLLLSQTPTVKVAKQLDGRIDSIQTYTEDSQEMRRAHASLSPDFAALSVVLTEIQDFAKEQKPTGRPFAIWWSGEGDLKIRAIERDDHLLSQKDLAIF